jgi:hypothetical protein
MATEGEAASALVARVRQQSRVVIDSELRRLSRRARSLRAHDLAVVDAALDDLVDRLILDPLRTTPRHVDQLDKLFDVPDRRRPGGAT